MSEKELKKKWKDLGYECDRFCAEYVFFKGPYKDIRFYNEHKEYIISSRIFSSFDITVEEHNLINETVKYLGWSK